MDTPGDRPDLPLEEEPFAFLHPRDAGTAAPVHGVGAREGLALEEEPAQWIAFAVEPRPPLDGGGGPALAPGPGRPGPRDAPLPATGGAPPLPLAAAGIAAAWLLRRRSGDPGES